MLKCISPYKSSLGSYSPGDVIGVPALCEALLKDSPGSFLRYTPEYEKAVEEAPEDKMIRSSTKKVIKGGDDG